MRCTHQPNGPATAGAGHDCLRPGPPNCSDCFTRHPSINTSCTKAMDGSFEVADDTYVILPKMLQISPHPIAARHVLTHLPRSHSLSLSKHSLLMLWHLITHQRFTPSCLIKSRHFFWLTNPPFATCHLQSIVATWNEGSRRPSPTSQILIPQFYDSRLLF